MNQQQFQECMKIWIKPETWHTSHPCDTKRFNQAIQQLMAINGAKLLHPEDFSKQLYIALANEYPKLSQNFISEQVEDASQKYDVISSYLYDIRN